MCSCVNWVPPSTPGSLHEQRMNQGGARISKHDQYFVAQKARATQKKIVLLINMKEQHQQPNSLPPLYTTMVVRWPWWELKSLERVSFNTHFPYLMVVVAYD